MEVQGSSDAIGKTDKKEPLKCEECGLNPWKYRCPGCSIRSCSLPCVKAHKKRTSCTGKRDRTEFVPLKQFNDDLIISDYNLLEEAKRVAESAQRMRDGVFNKPYLKLPYKLRMLRNAANRRKINLYFLPNGMQKREKNQTRYNQRKDTIFWTIEWKFHSADVVQIDHEVDENTSFSVIIEKHLKVGPWNHPLKPFCEEQLHSLKLFIQKSAKGTKSPYLELDIKASISQQLAGITIIEYPVVHVCLPSASYDFILVKDDADEPLPQKPRTEDPGNVKPPSPKGVIFKEEEIEEDGLSMDPQILDLVKYMNSEPLDDFQTSDLVKPSGQQAENDKAAGNTQSEHEQDLKDVYKGLLGEVNPDDTLDLEGGIGQEGNKDEEQLEEGEISLP